MPTLIRLALIATALAAGAACAQDKVTFATLNVFGRQFNEVNGRGHNASHSVSLMIGKGFKGGVVGGIVPGGHAADIDPATGQATEGGELAATDSLAAVA